MGKDVVIGGSNIPIEVELKLGDFVDWLDEHYEIDQGSTALYWGLAHYLSGVISEKS